MKKAIIMKVIFYVFLLSILVFVSACGSSPTSSAAKSEKSASKSEKSDSKADKSSSNSLGAELNFAIGATGGSNYPIGVAITQILKDAKIPGLKNITTVPGGGAAVMEGVNSNQMQMGMAFSSMVYDGFHKNAPFKEVTSNAVPLFSLHPYYLSLVVPEKSEIRSFADLKGKRVNLGPNGFSTVVIGQRLLKFQGFKDGDVKVLNLGITDAIEQLKDGHVDALFYSPTNWFGAYLELAQSTNIRQVPIDQALLKKLNETNQGWLETKWPINSEIYKGVQPAATLAHHNVIVVNPKAVNDELAYNIVKVIAENFTKIQGLEKSLELMKPSDLAAFPGDKYHPGAEKYFKEKGWIK